MGGSPSVVRSASCPAPTVLVAVLVFDLGGGPVLGTPRGTQHVATRASTGTARRQHLPQVPKQAEARHIRAGLAAMGCQ